MLFLLNGLFMTFSGDGGKEGDWWVGQKGENGPESRGSAPRGEWRAGEGRAPAYDASSASLELNALVREATERGDGRASAGLGALSPTPFLIFLYNCK